MIPLTDLDLSTFHVQSHYRRIAKIIIRRDADARYRAAIKRLPIEKIAPLGVGMLVQIVVKVLSAPCAEAKERLRPPQLFIGSDIQTISMPLDLENGRRLRSELQCAAHRINRVLIRKHNIGELGSGVLTPIPCGSISAKANTYAFGRKRIAWKALAHKPTLPGVSCA
jgi:hypothetical protein